MIKRTLTTDELKLNFLVYHNDSHSFMSLIVLRCWSCGCPLSRWSSMFYIKCFAQQAPQHLELGLLSTSVLPMLQVICVMASFQQIPSFLGDVCRKEGLLQFLSVTWLSGALCVCLRSFCSLASSSAFMHGPCSILTPFK